MAQVTSINKTLRRRAKKCYHFSEMGSTPVRLKFWVMAGEQVPAFENVPDLSCKFKVHSSTT
jgi:hypothetical protein